MKISKPDLKTLHLALYLATESELSLADSYRVGMRFNRKTRQVDRVVPGDLRNEYRKAMRNVDRFIKMRRHLAEMVK